MKKLIYLFVMLSLMAGLFFSPFVSPAVSAAAACGDTYTVKQGDYLTRIAKDCGVSYNSLLKANPEIKDPNLIYPGQVIRIKAGATLPNTPSIPVTGTQEYIVVRGDTLAKIAARFSTTVQELLRLNPEIKDASKIYVGQKIRLPGSTSSTLVTLSVTSLKAGESLDVKVKGYPVNAEIDFRLGKDGQTFSLAVDGKTDANGEASARLTIPASAVVGEKWVVQVLTTAMSNGKDLKSALITIK